MAALGILWFAFLGLIIYLGEERARSLWVGLILFIFVANAICLVFDFGTPSGG